MKIITIFAVILLASCSGTPRIEHCAAPYRVGWENGDRVIIDGPNLEVGNTISFIFIHIGEKYDNKSETISLINSIIKNGNYRYTSIERAIGDSVIIQYFFCDTINARDAFGEVIRSKELKNDKIDIVGKIKLEK